MPPTDTTMSENLPERDHPTEAAAELRSAADKFADSLISEVPTWYASLFQEIRDRVRPPKLPPLQLTSKPVPVKELWGDYRYGEVARPTSLAIHGIILALLIVPLGREVVEVVKKEIVYTPLEISPYALQMQPDDQKVSGGGGGGDRSPEPASPGKLPKLALLQITPPAVVIRNPEPKLPAEPTVVVPPQISLPTINIAQLGDPLNGAGMPSSGPGFGGGIGSGSGGGVGSGRGPGVGPGEGGGIGGGVFRVGGGVSAPQVVYKVDPEYSEQARKSKYQGTVVLNLIVQSDGSVRDIRILQPLGLGLDEKAIEAVRQWRFKPGQRNGQPVDVAAIIEVTFRLL